MIIKQCDICHHTISKCNTVDIGEKIGKYVGFGTELFSVKDNRENCEFVVTTTGVLLVCHGNFIITMICPDFQRMASVHKMAGREMTSKMIEQVKKNEKKAKRLGF